MAFFKFRKGGDDHPAPPPAPASESVEVLRKRARHRLIGAALLVLMGVIGFPLLFDNQPRPIAVDIPIEIPDKAKSKPLPPVLQPVAGPQATGVVGTGAAPAASAVVANPVASPVSAAKPEAKVEAKPETKPQDKPADKAAEKPADKPAAKSVDKPSGDGAKAQALLDGKTPDPKPDAAPARFVVQVGAYADVPKAHEARMKVERAGLKTYTQVVNPPEGKRIRVRVGPFDSKAEADKVAEKIKKLDLPASVLEL
jgi:DedD protein